MHTAHLDDDDAGNVRFHCACGVAGDWNDVRRDAIKEFWDHAGMWQAQCSGCGHVMADHRLDWDRTDEGMVPDCSVVECECMDFWTKVN